MTDLAIVLTDVSATDEDALVVALVRARASERSEVERLSRLVTTGYGDRAGGTMSHEADRAQARIDMLTRLLDAIRE